MRQLPPDAVIISANENPPRPGSLRAGGHHAGRPTGGRYDKLGVANATVKTLSEQFGLKPGYVELYPGSGGPLDMALMSSISKTRGLVVRRSKLRAGSACCSKAVEARRCKIGRR